MSAVVWQRGTGRLGGCVCQRHGGSGAHSEEADAVVREDALVRLRCCIRPDQRHEDPRQQRDCVRLGDRHPFPEAVARLVVAVAMAAIGVRRLGGVSALAYTLDKAHLLVVACSTRDAATENGKG